MFHVQAIDHEQVTPWLLKKHYARRLCPITYSFGIYDGSDLIGVVTYGCPASSSLRSGICGKQWEDKVIELNRLCCDNRPNIASMLVGRSLQLLPKPLIVVSYADTGQGHVGYVYQATNFIYTGLSAKRTDWKIKGRENLHGQTVADMFTGKGRADKLRAKFGDDFYLKDRPRKHRYVYFIGNKLQKKQMMDDLKYPICSVYPKGQSHRYDCSAPVETQPLLFEFGGL